jgi:hypothetical protein
MSSVLQKIRLSRAEGLALVAAWYARDVGQNMTGFCQQRGIGPWVLYYWRGRESVGAQASASGFVEVTQPVCSSVLEVVVGAASVVVRSGFDAHLLRCVVQALAPNYSSSSSEKSSVC